MDLGDEAWLNCIMRSFASAGWVVIATWLAACSFTPAQVADDGDDDTDGDVDPIQDAGDGFGADGSQACLERCDGDELISCDGLQVTETVCSLGCVESPTPHCAEIDPSNLASLDDLSGVSGTFDFDADTTYLIDTDTGEVYAVDSDYEKKEVLRLGGQGLTDGVRFRIVDDELAVLAVSSLAVPEDATIAGYGERALIILSAGEVEIDGFINWMPGICGTSGGSILLSRGCGGPGGGDGGAHDLAGAVATGCAPGGAGSLEGFGRDTGGAGGGLATSGASGGASGMSAAALPSSRTSCTSATLEPLQGGSGGGAAGGSYGGGGGGALQITSLVRIRVGSGATVYVGGAGGKGSLDSGGGQGGGGGGGGSGGGLLLEAPTVSLTAARLVASGGGGGGGRLASDPGEDTEFDGEWGTWNRPAAGGEGSGTGPGSGRGGAGGYMNSPTSSPATAGASGGDGTGGGGGGVGYIRINTSSGAIANDDATLAGWVTYGELVVE